MKRNDLTTDERLTYMPMWERVAMGATGAGGGTDGQGRPAHGRGARVVEEEK